MNLHLFPRKKRRRDDIIHLTLITILCILQGTQAKKLDEFIFTAPLYNYSFVENGRSIAKCDDLIRPGVPLLPECTTVEFRVISGDSDSNGVSSKDRFDSSPHRIGNFVFMKISQRPDQQPLNRELKSHYSLIVRAHCTKRDSSKLETTTNINIRVEDVNDQSPLPEEDIIETKIDALSIPFTHVVCVAASDADSGVNGEVIYSLAERNGEYTIDPFTGCIRTLRSPLRHNSTTLRIRIEDRASRLFYYDDKTRVEASFAEVKITVMDRRRDRLNVLVEKKSIDTSEEAIERQQIAAVIRVEEERTDEREKEPKYDVVIMNEHETGGLFDLRRETPSSWSLLTRPHMHIPSKPKVWVRAGTDSAHERNTTAEITLDTIELHNITFEKTEYSFIVREDMAIGRPIGIVSASVLRREDEKTLSYRIETTSEESVPFSIDEESGRIRVSSWLDYEMKNDYSFNVLAKLKGHGHQTMTGVKITVEDSNDHTPSFPVKLTRMNSIVIPEKAKPGYPLLNISSLDRDSGLNGKISYRLIALPPSKGEPPFKIDTNYGNITLGRLPLNESSWMIGVIASDNSIDPRIAQLTLAFHKNGSTPLKLPDHRLIVNMNEHAPVLLDEEESFEIDEDAEIGEIIGRIPCRDDDSYHSESLRFATLDHHIDIDDNGTLTVARPPTELLPHGKQEILHPFMVTVYDRGVPSKNATRQYAVRIRDVNDHAPVFDKPWYRIRVAENTPEGTVVLKVSATDEDGGENGRVRYEMAEKNTVSDGGSMMMITVDEKSGDITLNGQLDRETAESHRFTIMAYDGGSPSRISFANLTIDVDDVNDNPPRCAQQQMMTRISEDWPDGALVGCIAAHDDDAEANGRLAYALEMERMNDGEPWPFRIDRHSGCVFVKSKIPLDYEKRSSYNLSIEVSDNGETPLSTLCHLTVELIDINENRHPPAFEDTVLEASVYENEPIGTLVINLVVNDADGGGGNGSMEIVGGDGRAAFTVVGGDVRTSIVLDRERQADYWLTVRATDNAPNALSSHVFIYIRVLDRSDHSPLFRRPFYAVDIIENAAPDTIVVKVEADDGDWPPSGKAARLRYSIEKGDPQSFFKIDPNTGYITTGGSRKLDRETQKMHELEIKVTTLDEVEMNTGYGRVYVRIIDENDNSPVFVHPNKHYEVPAERVGILCRVLATDADEGDNAAMSFTLKTLEPGYSIDNDGYISTSSALTVGQVSTLDVIVRDGGNPSRETTTRIVLNGVKMNAIGRSTNTPPSIEKEVYKFDVSDADQVGNPIGILSATDADGDRLWWSIVNDDSSSNFSSFFDINAHSGTLILASPIDRLPPEIGKMRLTVRVTDGVAHADAKVRILLSRQPISRPVFEKSHYEIKRSEKTPIGSSLLSPKVTGYGSRPIEYGIGGVESERTMTTIGVDPSTGNVMLVGALDYETERLFHVILFARQGSLTGYSMLTVRVLDENDNAPLFTQLEYDVSVPSNTSSGTVVATVTAFDADEGENGLVVYEIISGNELGFFTIDRECGEVRTTKEMLHSEHYESILTIRASDRGGDIGALSGLSTLRIRTSESSVGTTGVVKPKFERSLYHLSVRENTPVGSLLLLVSAHSSDGHIRYESLKKCSWFDVHPVSGAIRLKRWLTRVRAKSINCTIVARGKDDTEAMTKIVVRVIETNEHSPIFRQQIYHGIVRENATEGITVQSKETGGPLVVSATDKDSGTNALIGFKLLKDDPYFMVDLLSGTIRTRRSLDFEKISEWRLHIIAHDMGHPPRYSALPALIIISIQDINDAPPTFDVPSIETDLVLPSVAGVKIARVEARDVDTVGEIRYYMKGNETSGIFRVDSKSGDVVLETADRKIIKEKSYTLEVLATDGLHSSSQQIRIKVKNASQSDLRFTQSVYMARLYESDVIPMPVPLVTVSASLHSDPSQSVTYTLLNTRDDFSIVPSTGLISYLGSSIDREIEDHVLLLVQAHVRSSSKTAQCIVRVTIGDINDNAPRFLSLPYHVAIPKNTKKGAKVVQVHAVDGDYGVNGSVVYSSTDLPSQFELNGKNGKISLKEPFEKDGQIITFTVTASDNGVPPLSTDTVVKVEIVDSTRPRFTQRQWNGTVDGEKMKKGDTVVSVHGKSEADRSRLIYSIDNHDDDDGDYAFEIDRDTGVISLRESPSSLTKSVYTLTVSLTDAIRPKMTDTATVSIEVVSVSSSFIHFTNSSYRVSISEESPIGTHLLQLSIDSSHDDDSLVYTLSGVNATAFHMNPSSGLITLASPLNFEQQRLFVLKASVERREDIGKRPPAYATVVVEVMDANDEVPIFTHTFSSAAILDTAKTGDFVTLMTVTDKDTVSSLPDGARLLYSVIDGDDTMFVVDKHTGAIRIGRDIEEEDVVERTKVLNISVSDGLHTQFGRLTIDIDLSGERSRAPRFEQSQYVVSTKESNHRSSPSSSLVRVRALGGVSPLRYSLGGGLTASWPVSIDHTSGKVHLKTRVDSHHDDYVIPLIVTDSLRRHAFSTLTLRVIDDNDHSPEFALQEYSCSISAGAKSGESVLTVSAMDEDDGDTLEYALMGDSYGLRIDERIGLISIGSDNRLSKMVGTTISLVVRATDGGNPPHSANAQLSLTVLPADVAIPRFANSLYRFNVAEDASVGFLVGRVQQIASDVGEVRYEMQPKSASLPFNVDRNGKIVVQSLLDREKQSLYRFVMVAHAAGGAHSLATVVIQVEDVNDNAPLFRGTYEGMSVREDAPIGTSIAVFSATDADDASNAKITFSLIDSSDSSDVSMDSSSGWLTVASSLDRERKAVYTLMARATDQGGKHTDLPFTLNIEDVNDEAPFFDEKNYTINIDPSILADTQTIGRVTVKDRDLPPNNLTRLFIVRGNDDGLFSIDNTGRITVAEMGTVGLIAAGARKYDLEVLAHDGKHSTTAIVTIMSSPSISNTVDCPMEDTVVVVAEDVPVGWELSVPSQSIKGGVYKMISTLASTPFNIDEDKGTISVSELLDREKIDQYSFIRRLTCSPSGANSIGFECDERIVVNVKDINDHAPVFDKESYSIGVKENEPATESERVYLIRVEARDEDRGAAGRVKYALAPHSDNGPFRIDDRLGVITLIEPLDREKKAEYEITVVATDGGEQPRSARASVNISVADQNDNAPEFEKKEYATRIMELESIGYKILELNAIGGDDGESVRYSLVEGHAHNEYVTIDPQSGVLTLSKEVDYEKERSLSIRVKATDTGEPPLSTETIVSIEILDENDNDPQFEKNLYEANVSEAAKDGTVIVNITATDADSDHYGSIQYSIREDEEKDEEKKKRKKGAKLPFKIGKETGVITLKGSLDYETTTEYNFEVVATDGGSRVSSAHVKITVLDENDHAPLFAECNLTAIVQKAVDPGHILLTLSLSDADSPKYGGPPFKTAIIGDGSEAFSIDDRLNIVTTSKLAKTKGDYITLKVRATDKGGKSSECPLAVIVKEESSHAPKVRPLTIKMFTLHGEFPGRDIGWIEATDEDKDDLLRYSLIESSVKSPGDRTLFTVNPELGSIYCAPGIANGTHSMNVSVYDGRFYSFSAVSIEVTEIDSNIVDHTIIVRVHNTTIAEFFATQVKSFKKSLSNAANVTPDRILILSAMDVGHHVKNGHKRHHRAAPREEIAKAVDVAFIVIRRPNRGGYLRPREFYSAVKRDKSLQSPFSITSDLCTKSTCRAGACVDEVVFLDQQSTRYTITDEEEDESTSSSLVVPLFERRAYCQCPQGKGGVDCGEEVNGCARSSCSLYEMCIPLSVGVGASTDCVCPPGTKGDKCSKKNECHKEGKDKCVSSSPLHVDGRAFIEIDLPTSFDRSMDLSIEFRTTTRDGYVMYAEGEGGDSHSLQIRGGNMVYVWDAGSGEIMVESTIEIADGAWHTVWVKRNGRSVEMRVDQGAKIIGEAPAGSEVVNLWRWSKVLVLGAKVRYNSTDVSLFELSHGLSSCIRTIKVDQTPLILTSNGLRLFNVKIGCRELAASPCFGPNGTTVCQNDGKCIALHDGGYRCECSSSRYTGRDCDMDREPCSEDSMGRSPCPIGAHCVPFDGRPQCKCKEGWTGEACDQRINNDWTEKGSRPSDVSICIRNPSICGDGSCFALAPSSSTIENRGYLCMCNDGKTRTINCDQDGVTAFFSLYTKELIVGIVSILVITLIAILIIRFCRFKRSKNEGLIYDDHVYTPHGVNPKLNGGGGPSTGHSTLIQPPPPLPPRTFRNGRPTIEVRPYAGDERVSSSRGDSGDSLNGSFTKPRKGTRVSDSRTSEHFDLSHDDSSALRDLEALRRIGLPLPDDPSTVLLNGVAPPPMRGQAPPSSNHSHHNHHHDPPPLHARKVRGRDGQSRGDALIEERLPLGDDWEGARNTPMHRIDHAVRNEQERRRRQAAGGGMKVEMNGNGRVAVADTLLSPVENDPEYMTMRPRGGSSKGGTTGSNESQKIPLLAPPEDDDISESTTGAVSHRPPLPAHGDGKRMTTDTIEADDSSMWQSRLYDDPVDFSSQRKSEATSALIGDIDGTDDEEAPPLPNEAPPTFC